MTTRNARFAEVPEVRNKFLYLLLLMALAPETYLLLQVVVEADDLPERVNKFTAVCREPQ